MNHKAHKNHDARKRAERDAIKAKKDQRMRNPRGDSDYAVKKNNGGNHKKEEVAVPLPPTSWPQSRSPYEERPRRSILAW